MEPAAPIRITFELEASLKDAEGVMELARQNVRETHDEKDWAEFDPVDLQDAFQTLFSNAVLETFLADGPLDLHASSTTVETVPNAWWIKG